MGASSLGPSGPDGPIASRSETGASGYIIPAAMAGVALVMASPLLVAVCSVVIDHEVNELAVGVAILSGAAYVLALAVLAYAVRVGRSAGRPGQVAAAVSIATVPGVACWIALAVYTSTTEHITAGYWVGALMTAPLAWLLYAYLPGLGASSHGQSGPDPLAARSEPDRSGYTTPAARLARWVADLRMAKVAGKLNVGQMATVNGCLAGVALVIATPLLVAVSTGFVNYQVTGRPAREVLTHPELLVCLAILGCMAYVAALAALAHAVRVGRSAGSTGPVAAAIGVCSIPGVACWVVCAVYARTEAHTTAGFWLAALMTAPLALLLHAARSHRSR